jgi:hypothetical protein
MALLFWSRNVDTRFSNIGSPVTKEEKYRRYAAELVDLASRAESNQQKRRLLAMAEAWLDLADRARRRASSSKADAAYKPETSGSLLSDLSVRARKLAGSGSLGRASLHDAFCD